MIGLEQPLRELVENPNTSEMMRLPKVTDTYATRREMRNIHDSTAWSDLVVTAKTSTGALFGEENERRNIVVSVNIDGFSPFKRSSYTMQAIQMMVMNLPTEKRHRPPYLITTMMIPGPKKPNFMAPYLRVMLDELQRLELDGFTAYDPLLNKKVQVRVKLLSLNCDLPAHSDNCMQQGSSAKFGCFKCVIQVSDYHL